MRRVPVLEARGISKKFGGVQALQDVDFELFEKEVVALVGENGAGKSTLIKIISGVYPPDSGEIFFNGKKVMIESPRDARRLRIETVYQDLALADNVDIATNIFMGRELIKETLGNIIRILDKQRMENESRKLLGKLKVSIGSMKSKVRDLSGGQRQAVAVGRATYWEAEIIILDEPTAALGVEEAEKVLDLIRRLKQRAVTVLMISHNLQHVFSVVDRIIVLRAGKKVGEKVANETSREEIVRLIVG